MSRMLHSKTTAVALLTGMTMMIAGCAELQTLADSVQPPVDRLQRQLQSNDAQVRQGALSQIVESSHGALDSDQALKNIILGQRLLESGNGPEVNYPEDVRIGAVDKLFEKGRVLALINLADDYRIGGGKMAMVNGEGSIVSYMKRRARTPEGLEKLCRDCSQCKWGPDWQRIKFFLLGTEKSSPLSDECLLWAVRHVNDETIQHVFDPEWNSAKNAGVNIVKKLTNIGNLKSVAVDTSCLVTARVVAAEQVFNHKDVKGKDILEVIGSFEKADDEQMARVAQAGLAAAKRIGANDVVKTLEGN